MQSIFLPQHDLSERVFAESIRALADRDHREECPSFASEYLRSKATQAIESPDGTIAGIQSRRLDSGARVFTGRGLSAAKIALGSNALFEKPTPISETNLSHEGDAAKTLDDGTTETRHGSGKARA